MSYVKKIFNCIHKILLYLGMLQILAIIIIVSAQVFCRFILGFSIWWADEVSLILMIWFSFISIYIGVNRKLHLTIDIVTMNFPEKVKKNFVEPLTNISTLIFGIVMMYYGTLLAQNAMLSTLPATGLPSAVEYLFVPIAGFMIAYDSLMDLFRIQKEDNYIHNEILGGEADA